MGIDFNNMIQNLGAKAASLQKDASKIKRYLTEAGKIIPRRITGTCAKHQRRIASAVKKAREAGVISYVFD